MICSRALWIKQEKKKKRSANNKAKEKKNWIWNYMDLDTSCQFSTYLKIRVDHRARRPCQQPTQPSHGPRREEMIIISLYTFVFHIYIILCKQHVVVDEHWRAAHTSRIHHHRLNTTHACLPGRTSCTDGFFTLHKTAENEVLQKQQ